MKKGLKKVGIAILASVVFLALGCQQQPDYKGAGYTDQQITLGTPSVRGKAYPGVNYIFWDRVANAKNGYALSIYEDGIYKDTVTLTASTLCYADTDVKYDVEKTYKVRAIGDSAGRYVIYTESDAGSITLIPIVPPTDTDVLDLAKYEKEYKSTTPDTEYALSEEDAGYQLSASTISVKKNEADGSFTVTFPAKAYLSYTVYADYGNTFEITGVHEYNVGTYSDYAVNNKFVSVKGNATIAGDYNIYVKAVPQNAKYFNSVEVGKANALHYNALAISSDYTAKDISFSYQNETTLDVSWKPAILADGTYAIANHYKIYKTVAGLTNFEAVTAAITVDGVYTSNVPTYKFTDTTDGASYNYIFILTDGKSFAGIATNATAPAYKDSYSSVTTSLSAAYTDSSTIHVEWTPATKADGSTVASGEYVIYRKIAGQSDSAYAPVEGSAVKVTTLLGNTYYYFDDTVTDNKVSYVYYVGYNEGITRKYSTTTVAAYKDSYSSSTATLSASYTDASKVCLSWTPASLADGTFAPITAYKAYRKVAGEDDSTYIEISEVKSLTTLFGSTTYYVDDSITDNTVKYVYLLVYTNGTAKTTLTATLDAYKVTYTSSDFTVTSYYTADDTIRIKWSPASFDGKTLDTSAYEVLRRPFYNSTEADWVKIAESTASSKNQGNDTVYYVDTTVEDNTISYYYSVRYRYNATVYYKTFSVAAYSQAVVYSVPVVTLFAAEDDAILNDVRITLSVSDDQKFESIKYIKRDTNDNTNLLAVDYTEALALTSAITTEEENGNTYEWTLSNLEAGQYVSVVAIVDGNAKYATSAITKDEPDSQTVATNSSVAISWKSLDDDGLANDAFVLVTLADDSKVLSSVAYGTADNSDEAQALAEAGTNSLEIDGRYKVYAFTLKDAATETGTVLYVKAVISEQGKKDNSISSSTTYNIASADGFSLYKNTINLVMADDDGLVNDVSFAISAVSPETSFKIIYALADDTSTAVKLLDSKEARVLTESLTGYTFYELNSADYDGLKDIPLGKFIAIRVTASQADRIDITTTPDWNSTSAAYDAWADNRTIEPTDASITFIAMDEDRIANDLYLTLEVYDYQSISDAYFVTATKAEYTANNTILADRLNSSVVTAISADDITEKYRTEEKIIYEAIIKDFAVDAYVGLRCVISEEGKLDYTGTLSAGPVAAVPVVIVTTAAPTLSQANIYFDSYHSDSNFNDIKQDDITVTVGIDQSIKSITYAYAEDKDTVNKLLRTDSTFAHSLDIPSGYDLTTSISGTSATLKKNYNFTPYINNVPDGNIVGIKIVISEPGCNDFVRTIYTAEGSVYDNWIDGNRTVPATASQFVPEKPALTVNDNKNWEYVHVVINDYFLKDSLSNYTYKLERTFEDWYEEPDAVWETIEDEISLEWNGWYNFNKWYKDIPVGNYVYRLIKTRKASASVTGEEETIVTDAKVSVDYHVALDTLSFSDYSAENLVLDLTEYMDPNYDHLDKYNYTVSYRISYYDANDNYIYPSEEYSYGPTEWTELTDWDWTEEKNEDDIPTGNYLLTDAVISGINSDDPNVKSARVYVQLYKNRKIAGWEDASVSAELLLNWGITASISPSSSVAINNMYTYSDDVEGYTWVHVEADAGFDSYTWYVDEITQGVDGNVLDIQDAALSSGSHEIVVVAKDGSIPYSATITYSK